MKGFLFPHTKSSRSAFTLIELLVVIAIIAILAVVVVLTLNPAELLKQSRDANRISDVATLTSALNIYITDQGSASSFSLGAASATYPSVYDPSATSSAGDQCQGLGFLVLNASSGQYWQCSPSSTVRNVNSTGWIPVNLLNLSSGSPIGNLPIDPTNQTSTGLIYAYNTNGTQFEVTANLESTKYKNQYGQSAQTNAFPEVISGGTPTVSALYSPTGLVGYWSLDEGSGSTVKDLSGNGNSGAWNGAGPYYTSGKVGSFSGNFSASTGFVSLSTTTIATSSPTAFTISAWVNMNAFTNITPCVACFNEFTGSANLWGLYEEGANGLSGVVGNAAKLYISSSSLPSGWNNIAFTWNGTTAAMYLNGSSTGSSFSDTTYNDTSYTAALGRGNNHIINATIDDVRVYNRALSAAEIQALYNAEK